ncbi:uncharacterized protein TRIADDRAFT_50801 [Trichoplax adhaerens]|uniref:Serine/threonine-protein kinase PLK n=1 Tax=Trichoplax adhaerens TaxID=10228 RepID=B3S755_TRIAD|nr:hypothetical protein TRIADDRAFT_50801 [Trichoplax adhaerens]EDV21422.1 hypothetical protein TRIADDRAFT_50801 [Trichoplax adhaerens]|eukprot:XP_002116022.1 hypothetical protein TRIADDRAFT_50801 [Trichoplax adhaerens]
MSSKTDDSKDIITVPSTGQRFRKGEFLGKGGFGRCYEFIDMKTDQKYAGKIVSKSMLVKAHHRSKMASEIAIHKTINHPNIVKFITNFENEKNVYIVLELCSKKSLYELQKRRRYLTEAEVRYFMSQAVSGCKHLHDLKIIHRDLKLANIFIDGDLNLKLGDFGLAAQIEHDGERKRTLCGTPNYIAPEILKKLGHSFGVDAWSLGCIMYTLLVGKPPFETETLHETYRRIKDNNFQVPSSISKNAGDLITKLLNSNPEKRPSMAEILNHAFFTSGYFPSKLPHSCLVAEPNFADTCLVQGSRQPFHEVNYKLQTRPTAKSADPKPNAKPANKDENVADKAKPVMNLNIPKTFLAGKFSPFADEGITPSMDPMYWISKWVDYSDKYGFGYQLTDSSHGVFFNDGARLILAPDRVHLQYIDSSGNEQCTTTVKAEEKHVQLITKKLAIINHFVKYMDEKLVQSGRKPFIELDSCRLPYVYSWLRTETAICMLLSNGVAQINFFQDHKKLVICPRLECVSVVRKKSRMKTYRMCDILRNGCTSDLLSRLHYSRGVLELLRENTPKFNALAQ